MVLLMSPSTRRGVLVQKLLLLLAGPWLDP